MSFPLVGNLSENQKDCGQAAMAESNDDVALLINSLLNHNYFSLVRQEERRLSGKCTDTDQVIR
jgi:hypothetical protein